MNYIKFAIAVLLDANPFRSGQPMAKANAIVSEIERSNLDKRIDVTASPNRVTLEFDLNKTEDGLISRSYADNMAATLSEATGLNFKAIPRVTFEHDRSVYSGCTLVANIDLNRTILIPHFLGKTDKLLSKSGQVGAEINNAILNLDNTAGLARSQAFLAGKTDGITSEELAQLENQLATRPKIGPRDIGGAFRT